MQPRKVPGPFLRAAEPVSPHDFILFGQKHEAFWTKRIHNSRLSIGPFCLFSVSLLDFFLQAGRVSAQRR